MGTTSNQVANQAILLMGGNQPNVTGNAPTFDSSTNGKILQVLYAPCVATVTRQFAYDFARGSIALTLTGNVAPFPWTYEYSYVGVEVWQLTPPTLADVNNPLPVNWVVGNAQVSGQPSRVIWTNLANAVAFYNDNPPEITWDSLFQEAVVRLLASELSIAAAGKPDTSREYLESGAAFNNMGMERDS